MSTINETYPKTPSPCYCMNIRRASRATTLYYDGLLKPSGLTIAQMGMLRYLEMSEPTTITELANRIRIDRTTLNRNMKPLLESGLIHSSIGKDSRTRLIALTESGKTALASAVLLWEQAQMSLKEYLGDDDQEKLGQLLSKLEALVP